MFFRRRPARTEAVHDVSSQKAGRSKNGRSVTWSRVSGVPGDGAKLVNTSYRRPAAPVRLDKYSRGARERYLPPATVRIGLPVLVILTSELMYRRQTVGRFAARGIEGIWAVKAAPERAQRRGEAMVATFNGGPKWETQACQCPMRLSRSGPLFLANSCIPPAIQTPNL